MNPTAIVDAAGFWSYAVVFLLTAAETSAFFGILMPGESLVLVGGALAAKGALDPVALAAVVVSAAVIGDSIGYLLGRWFERRPGAEGMRRRTARARDFLQRRGGPAVFAGRFIGFVRSFVPFAAGGSGLPYRRFLAYSASAAVIWGVGSVAGGYYLGPSVEQLVRTVGVVGAAVLVGVMLTALLVVPAVRRRTGLRSSAVGAGTGAGVEFTLYEGGLGPDLPGPRPAAQHPVTVPAPSRCAQARRSHLRRAARVRLPLHRRIRQAPAPAPQRAVRSKAGSDR
ncbi:membrane protein DedA with SNARE-associated domain [Streptomyces sp. 846.5]|nr:DedA family protein [Streptomyces sp. 846.5]TDT98485.1 membrane protein DedA with SNARE-associated domain [Streptomyces sp. 846.5]